MKKVKIKQVYKKKNNNLNFPICLLKIKTNKQNI